MRNLDVAKAVMERQKAEKFYAQMHDITESHALTDMAASYNLLQQATRPTRGKF